MGALATVSAAIAATVATGTLLAAVPPATAAAPLSVSRASFVQQWSTGSLAQDKGNPIAQSSPVVATLDSAGPAVVVGDRTGYLYAYHLSDGSPVSGWPVYDGGAPIDSTPSVATLPGDALSSVFVGTGDAERPDVGGYEALGPNGQELWHTTVDDLATDKNPAYGVQASLTVGTLQGGPDVFAGSLDQLSYALDAANGAVLPGWPFFSADSVFSTASVGDLYGTGEQELVLGGASTAGLAMGHSYARGGHLRVLNAQGQQIYDQDTTQEVDSSPAIGDFLAGGATGIVVGTGSQFPDASDTDTIKAFTTRLGLVWSGTLDGVTSSSPALADLEGNGQLEVVEGTDSGAAGGSVWALDGPTGETLWHVPVVGRVIGSVVAADLTGAGYQDVLAPTTHGVEVLDGRSGARVAVLGGSYGFQNSPLVTDDPNGTVGVTIAGYNGGNEGLIVHYEIPGSNGALAIGAGAWPMFHHDPALSGASAVLPDLGRSTPAGLTAQAGSGQVLLSWSAPPGAGRAPATGYNVYEATAPGHEQGAPVNGPTPVTGTNYAVPGLANGTKYYFEVTALNQDGEGAPSNEASASPVGPPGAPGALTASPGNDEVSLSWAAPSSNGGSPVSSYNVYISTTPGSQGAKVATEAQPAYTATGLTNGTAYYFEVTAVNVAGEGVPSRQVPAVPAPSPATTATTVPSAPTTSPPPLAPPARRATGYRVASAGGQVFSFGKARSYSLARPASPVSSLASTPDGLGYWLALKGGGVLARGDAHVYGSMAGRHPRKPIVGIAATPDGRGYWMVASDVGIFAFGDAGYYGSMGAKHLAKPIVGIAATPDGRGYWMVASDGGIFAFGKAPFYGSPAGKAGRAKMVGISGSASE
ncbi:MAG: fibronectin type III domain-containing protein [Acidimicrobiales bacterium]